MQHIPVQMMTLVPIMKWLHPTRNPQQYRPKQSGLESGAGTGHKAPIDLFFTDVLDTLLEKKGGDIIGAHGVVHGVDAKDRRKA